MCMCTFRIQELRKNHNNLTMFSCPSITKSSPLSVRRLFGVHQLRHRLFSNQSHRSNSSSSSSSSSYGRSSHGDNGRSGDSMFEWIMRAFSSRVAIVGSTLGFCYFSSSFSDSKNSFLAYADWRGETSAEDFDSFKPQKKHKFLFGDVYRRKIFFNYEKRIRTQSPPEKVFEYFASIKTPEGEILMTPADLMRAVVPVFSPSESNRVREGNLRGERSPGELYCEPSKFFMLFDTDNDGLISFPEYIFFVTLLSIPETSFSVAFKMFDLDNNGEIDREEFKKVMALMRTQNRQGAQHRDGLRLGLKSGDSVENGGLLEYFFGGDGKTCLKHTKFVQFLRDLHDEILWLEFSHYDYKSCGTISARDFALSLIASADITHINKFLDRVDELNNEKYLQDIRITFDEFKNFAELRKQLQSLSLAIFTHGKVNGLLTKKDFQRAASQVCGISLTENVIDIIFHVFDANRDGSLSSNEFVRVLHKRENGISQSREPGMMGLISCWLNCTKKKCSSANIIF